MILQIIVMAIVYVAIDFAWLGFVTKGFYLRELGPLAHVSATGGLAPDYVALVLVYVVAIIGLVVFVLPKAAGSINKGALYGALYGFIIYGVYDLTNRATLMHYSWKLAIADALYGTVVSAIVAVIGVWLG